MLDILWLPLLVGPFIGALAETLRLTLPWSYEHCLWSATGFIYFAATARKKRRSRYPSGRLPPE
jgi:hypothetical protein